MKPAGIPNDLTFARSAPDQTAQALIALTTTAQAVAVPTGASHVFFGRSNGVTIAVAYGKTASAAVAAFTTQTSSGSEINPDQRWLGKGGATNAINELSVIAATAGGFCSMDFRGSTG